MPCCFVILCLKKKNISLIFDKFVSSIVCANSVQFSPISLKQAQCVIVYFLGPILLKQVKGHSPPSGKIWVCKKDIKICHYISFVLLLYPSLTSKFLSYALAVHDIQYNRFYSQLKCKIVFENSVNCVTGLSASPVFSYTEYFYIGCCAKFEKWGMSLTLVQYSLCSFWQMFVMVITFTYSSHASLSKIWCNFVLSGGITTDYITNHIK